MQFVRVNNLMDGAQALSERLIIELNQHARVLWLVTGGSNIPISVAVMAQIPDELSVRLAVYLTDERFGPVGHPDSNFKQLMDAGFDPKNATVVPVLVANVGFDETVERFNQAIKTGFQAADIIIGQFGIGDDGHISGILPRSPAILSTQMVYGYKTPTYDRITTTFTAIKQLAAAYVFASGITRRQPLTDLKGKDLPLNEEPAQILKQLPESYVFSDQIDSTHNAVNTEGASI